MGVWLEVGREGQNLAKIIFCGQSSARFFHTAIVKIGDVQPCLPGAVAFSVGARLRLGRSIQGPI